VILAILENHSGQLQGSALAVVDAANKAKQAQGLKKIIGILLGAEGVEKAAASASKLGLDEVYWVESEHLKHSLSEPMADALKQTIEKFSPNLVLAGNTSSAKDYLPRVAALLDAGVVSDVMEFLPAHRFLRPMYAGNVIAEVELESELKLATVRLASFSPVKEVATAAPVAKLEIALKSAAHQRFVSFDYVKSERPQLADAKVVVSGGRALKSKENFENVILPLADSLGAAVGASRAAVDSGYAPNDWQVGQTGKVVAPELYIALGISGAIQHLAGMKDSKVIVAVNTDPEAPIFEVADYSLVADLFEVVPELITLINK
jgi:electron transfer flavoprotein alpha subunit